VMSAAGYFTGREDWRCSRWARAWTVLLLWPMNGQVAKPTYKKEKENVGSQWNPHQYHLLRVEAISWVLYFRIPTKREPQSPEESPSRTHLATDPNWFLAIIFSPPHIGFNDNRFSIARDSSLRYFFTLVLPFLYHIYLCGYMLVFLLNNACSEW